MTLDCTNLKPGDRVRLRNGEIGLVQENDESGIPIHAVFGDDEIPRWFKPDGKYYGKSDKDLNIAEILPPEPPTDCTSQQQAIAVAEELVARARSQAGAKVAAAVTSGSSLLEVTHDFIGCKHPDAINCNGKRYVPADSPSLFIGQPFNIITHPSEGVVALRYDDKLFTPADTWPEPNEGSPTIEDADINGNVQWLTREGWVVDDWDIDRDDCNLWYKGWAHTSDWKPKPTPVHTREEVLDMLRHDRVADLNIGDDLLASIITHLEASDE